MGMKREMERREGGRMEKRWRQWLDMDWGVVMVVWGLENIRGTERGWGGGHTKRDKVIHRYLSSLKKNQSISLLPKVEMKNMPPYIYARFNYSV